LKAFVFILSVCYINDYAVDIILKKGAENMSENSSKKESSYEVLDLIESKKIMEDIKNISNNEFLESNTELAKEIQRKIDKHQKK
jgi:hypothetical protein